MNKKVGIIKRFSCLCLVFLLSINSFAAIVSDNDGSAFITKAEFDALKSSFQQQIDSYNQSIDSKIDGAIASYLTGIKLSTTKTLVSFLPSYAALLATTKNNGHLLWNSGTANVNNQSYLRCAVDMNVIFENQGYGGNSTKGNYTTIEMNTINHKERINLDGDEKITLSSIPRCGLNYTGVGHNQNTEPSATEKTALYTCLPGCTGEGSSQTINLDTIFTDRTDMNKQYTVTYQGGNHNWSGLYAYKYFENYTTNDAWTKIQTNTGSNEYAWLRTGTNGTFKVAVKDDRTSSIGWKKTLTWPNDYNIWKETITTGGYEDLQLRYKKPDLMSNTGSYYIQQIGAENAVYYTRVYKIEGLLKNINLSKTEVAWLQSVHDKNRYYSDGIVLAEVDATGICSIKVKVDKAGYIMFNAAQNPDYTYGGKRTTANPTMWKTTENAIAANTEKTITGINVSKGDLLWVYYEPTSGDGEILSTEISLTMQD